MKKFFLAVFILWMPFSIGAIAAVPIALFAIATEEYDYAKNVLRAMDKLTAAVLGWSGMYSVSAECGRSRCAFCAGVCWLLDLIQSGHCKGAADREGR